MPVQLRRGPESLFIDGPDLVKRHKAFMRVTEERIPLRAISSLRVEQDARVGALVVAVVAGLLALVAFGNDAAGAGAFLLFVVAGAVVFFHHTRSLVFVADSPTCSIRFPALGAARDDLRRFMSEASALRDAAFTS